MKSATVRQLRHDFGSVLNWIEEGEKVEIRKRGKPVALISPPVPVKPRRRKKRPNFAARLKSIFGDKILPGNIVVEEREARPC
jgi:antitoxin (DNA-binding transcriptional repressor) of toxin-antitoxin stability system